MSEIRTDDEQLEALKNWWNENGKQLVGIVVLGAAGYFGWSFWQDHKTEQVYAANEIYMQLVSTSEQAASGGVALEEELQTIGFLAEQLQSEYSQSNYSTLGALVAARSFVDAGRLEDAQSQLEWALDNADTEAEAQLINYRLAKVLFAREQAEEALALLADPSSEYEALYADLRGDIQLSTGDRQSALESYQLAMDSLLPGQQHYLSTLELKHSNLTSGLGSQ